MRPNWKTDKRKARFTPYVCAIQGCTSESCVGYYSAYLCERHWNYYSSLPSEYIKKILGIKEPKPKQSESILNPFEEEMFNGLV